MKSILENTRRDGIQNVNTRVILKLDKMKSMTVESNYMAIQKELKK